MADVIAKPEAGRSIITQNLAGLLARDVTVISSSDDVSENETVKEDAPDSSIYSDHAKFRSGPVNMDHDEPFDLSTRRCSFSGNSPEPEQHVVGCDSSESAASKNTRAFPISANCGFSKYLNGVMLRLNDLRLRSLLCDVIFKVDNETFHAHKAVMASCSEFCRKKFLSCSENAPDQEIYTLEIHNLSSLGFRLLLDFIYTGELDVNDVTAQHITQAAIVMEMREIADMVAKRVHEFLVVYAYQNKGLIERFTESCVRPVPAVEPFPQTLDLSLKAHCKKRTTLWNGADLESKENLCKPRRSSDSLARSHVGARESAFTASPESLHSDIFNIRGGNGILNRANQMDDKRIISPSPTHWKKKYQNHIFDNEFSGHRETKINGMNRKSRDPPAKEGTHFRPHHLIYNRDSHPPGLNQHIPNHGGLPHDYPFKFQFDRLFNWMAPVTSAETLLNQRVAAFMQTPIPTIGPPQWSNFLRKRPSNAHHVPSLRPEGFPFPPALVLPRAEGSELHHGWRAPFIPPTSLNIVETKPTTSEHISTDIRHRYCTNGRIISMNADMKEDVETKKARVESGKMSPNYSINISPTNYDVSDDGRRSSESLEDKTDEIGSNSSSSRSRVQRTRGNKPYKCPLCDADFNRPANLKTHMRIHSGEKPFQCETCKARFVQVAHLRAHVLIHTGEKPYPCNVCGTRFRHLQTLKSHLRIHTGEKPYSCQECCVQFRHKSQLRLHLRQKHGIQTNTKKTYRQVPGLCSADICAHIKRVQEVTRSQSK
uniref:Zinc finger protein n=1 Tax=Ciona savignyi TaxID=51511 RepID=H2YZB4_CIOSA